MEKAGQSIILGGQFSVLIRKGSTMEIHLSCFIPVIFFISEIVLFNILNKILKNKWQRYQPMILLVCFNLMMAWGPSLGGDRAFVLRLEEAKLTSLLFVAVNSRTLIPLTSTLVPTPTFCPIYS